MENVNEIIAQRQKLEKSYASARSNLLLAIVLTVVNVVLFFADSGTMLLFSVSVPYFAVVFGYVFDITQVGVGVAVCILVVYLLCWLLSKKKSGWLIVAAVLFVVDTLAMAGLYLLMEDASGLMDGLIHIWVLYYLISGAIAGSKLKKLPQIQLEEVVQADVSTEFSEPLRYADENGKIRVFLEADFAGHHVCYRRVKKVNELVVDGKVYDEYKGLQGLSHNLKATIGGRTYEVGYGSNYEMYFRVDGVLIEKRIRWF